MQYFDKETVRLHVEILRILSKEKGYLQGQEIEGRLSENLKSKLLEPIPHFPQFRKNIYYHLTKLEMLGLVGSFDKDGNEGDYIPSSEKYYEIKQKGESIVDWSKRKTREGFVGQLFDIIGEHLVKRSGKRPEEVYKTLLELARVLDKESEK